MYWMDISRDDDGSVMSVVAGCDSCAVRTTGNNIADAQMWVSRHREGLHINESKTVRQIGDPLRLYASPIRDSLLKILLNSDEPIETKVLVDLLGKPYNSVHVALTRLATEGLIEKTKHGNKVLWQALEAGSQAPVAELRTATTLELVKPAERLLWPVYDINARILQNFGAHEEVYSRFGFRGHMGLDIGVVMQPVLAMHDGIVEFQGDGGEWPLMGAASGTCILLKGETFRTGYAHLSRSYVKIGDSVRAGEVIGISGDTGATTGFHLHAELMPVPHDHNNGYAGRVDPTPYLALEEASRG